MPQNYEVLVIDSKISEVRDPVYRENVGALIIRMRSRAPFSYNYNPNPPGAYFTGP